MPHIVASFISEKEFLSTVLEYSETQGWQVYHVFEAKIYARRTSKGFPDLVLLRGDQLIFAELKSEKGPASPAQNEWLTGLAEIAGIQVHVWRPSDWPTIERLLA